MNIQSSPGVDEALGKAELPGESKEIPELESDKTAIQELNHDALIKPELDHSTPRAELEGEWRGWEAPATIATSEASSTVKQ